MEPDLARMLVGGFILVGIVIVAFLIVRSVGRQEDNTP